MRKKIELKRLMKTSIFRLILIMFMVIVPINVLTLILSNTAVKEVQNQISQENQNAIELYMNQIDGVLKRVTVKLHYMARDNVDFGRLNSKEINDQDEYYKQMQSVVNLKNEFANILIDNSWVTGTFANFPDKDINIIQCSYAPYKHVLEEYIEEQSNKVNTGNFGEWKIVELDETQIILQISQYKNVYYGSWIHIKSLAKTLNLDEANKNSMQLFTDDAGKILYSNADKDLKQVDFEKTTKKYNKIKYVLVRAKSSCSSLNIVQIISKDSINQALPIMMPILQTASIMTLLILPLIMIFLQKWIIGPVNSLARAMKKIETGDVNFRITEENSGSEFEMINRNFNHMMDEVYELKIDVYEEQLEKQKIKMRFLNQQIQPHFILNAMNILYSYEQEEYPLIQTMILCLTKYFRYIVNARTDYVELALEMEHIRNYFEIQQTRYPDTFFAIVEYEEELANCLVPPLLIQNFSENAIKHSITIGNKIDIIVIAQKTGDGKIRIRLSDTGDGIDETLIKKVEVFTKTRVYQEGLGVGIQNAIERLDILYGEDANLQITHEKPQGTRIEIILPINYGNGDYQDMMEDR